MKFKIVLILIGILFFKSSGSQNDSTYNLNHLQPYHGYFTSFVDFKRNEYDKFFKGIEEIPLVRYVKIPSFGPITLLDVVLLNKNDGKIVEAELFYKSSGGKKFDKNIEIHKNIDAKSATVLAELMRTAIDNSRYIPTENNLLDPLNTKREFARLPNDGTSYLFIDDNYSLRVAGCHAPRNPVIKNLISAMEAVVQLMLSSSQSISFDENLMHQIEKVMEDL